MTGRLRRAAPLAAFAGFCYLPLLVTSPGQVVADTKSYLYLDPGRLLARAWSMWDPHVGMGTVTHQNIGFLWPMGPYYWAMEQLGVPDWATQRLWLGSILLAAGLGARYLTRTFGWRGPGIAVAMCAYAWTPYVLTIAVRISAILLPFAALPWMIGLTVRALRTGSWRHPAVFALVVATVGTSNATSILLAGIGPTLWVVWTLVTGTQRPGRVAAAVGRIGVLTLATNAWWIAGLSVQATHGVEVLRYTESVETTAAASSAAEVLRGLGYWFFYGDDALGPWVMPSPPFLTSAALLGATFAIPVLALAAGSLARWRERSFVVLLLLVGLALTVGVYPYDAPSPIGRLLARFLHSDIGMAMRSMPRAAPLVVLGLAVSLGAGVRALGHRTPRATIPAAACVIGLVVLSIPPLWQRTLAPENLRRPEDVPSYWTDAAAHLDATDDGTRVLEVPGADFTSYRWGTTIDPVTPGLTDRPMVARELVPMGSAAAANLLKAFDGRLQAHIAEPATVAPLARTMRAGQVLVRSDLAYEHYDTPRPRDLWHLLRRAAGLGRPTPFGIPEPNRAEAPMPMLDELELSLDPSFEDPPPVAVFPVTGAPPIVTTKPTAAPIVLAGDGEGIVDSAGAGLIDGTELIRYSAAMTDAELAAALDDGALLVLTDTNRRRAERWGTIRFTSGYTEPAGLRPLRLDRTDARLPLFPAAGDDSRTVAVQRGGITANATSYGGRNEYLPEDRPAHAVDGDAATAWRARRDDPVRGEHLELRLEQPVTTSRLTFLAPPPPINRWITRVALRFDGGSTVTVDLDETSRSAPGQTVDIGPRTFSTLDIEVLDDSAGHRGRYGGLTSTGFAEVTIGDRRLDEAIRPPVDLLARAGTRSLQHPLAVVLTRLRSAATNTERLDEESSLVRVLGLPDGRAFRLAGAARLSPRADDALVDSLLIGPAGTRPVATSSSRMAGPSTRASAALDGDPATAWVPAYGDQVGQWLDVVTPAPVAIDHLDLAVLADGRHSVPTALGLEVDGRRVATLTVPSIADRTRPGATTSVTLALPEPVTATRLRLVVDGVREITTPAWPTHALRTMPVGIAELGAAGLTLTAPTGAFSTGCRDDLLRADGAAVPVVVTGTIDAAIAGDALAVAACGDRPLELAAGSHELRSAPGRASAIDLDRLVLRSDAGGGAAASSGLLRAEQARPPVDTPVRVTVARQTSDAVAARIDGVTPGQPFWLVFGQSWSDGWRASIDGHDLGRPVLVDGFANGWRIDPEAPGVVVSLEFTPQRRVDVALWGSLAAAVVCLALALRRPASAHRPAPAEPGGAAPAGAVPATPTTARRRERLPLPLTAAVTVLAGSVGTVLVTPVVGALTALVALVACLAVAPWWATALVAPVAMLASAAYVVTTVVRHDIAPGLDWARELSRAHPLAWFAVLALAADAAVSALGARQRR